VGNRLEGIEQLCDPVVGGFDAIGGDVLPYRLKVEERSGARNVFAHERGFRRCSDFLWSRTRDRINGLAAVDGRKTAAELGIKLRQLGRSGRVMLFEETSASRTTSLAEL
jgi:hypothetical protein